LIKLTEKFYATMRLEDFMAVNIQVNLEVHQVFKRKNFPSYITNLYNGTNIWCKRSADSEKDVTYSWYHKRTTL